MTGAPAIRAADSDRITGVADPPAPPVRSPVQHRRTAVGSGPGDGATIGLVIGLSLFGVAVLAAAAATVGRRTSSAPATR